MVHSTIQNMVLEQCNLSDMQVALQKSLTTNKHKIVLTFGGCGNTCTCIKPIQSEAYMTACKVSVSLFYAQKSTQKCLENDLRLNA